MVIDVVSDVICPWCYIGKRKLDKALRELAGEFHVTVRWRAYQLDASTPEAGLDRQQSLARKFGSADKARKIYKNISEAGEADGINFRFEKIQRTPNTLNAHRVIYWAMNKGLLKESLAGVEELTKSADDDERQHALVEELFQLYFEQGQDLGDPTVLIGACQRVGLDSSRISGLLEGSEERDLVGHEHHLARGMGISGVPCLIINNQYMLMGAQDPVRLARALRKIYAEEINAMENTGVLDYGEYGSL
ncbi:MAG: putative DsbA family dithiol-disulfide isomerase [Oceanicoccus sp.]|jgi:predicted DsbA family dithiol-disulfide isomerase